MQRKKETSPNYILWQKRVHRDISVRNKDGQLYYSLHYQILHYIAVINSVNSTFIFRFFGVFIVSKRI